MPIVVYLIIGLFITTLAGGIVYTYNHAIAKAERVEAENKELMQVNKDQLAENQDLRLSNATKDKLLAKRQAQRNTSEEFERKVDAALSKALQDKDTRVWADTPVPSSIVNSLRVNEFPTDKNKDTKGSSSRKPTSGTENK